jgi:hypothetical protein
MPLSNFEFVENRYFGGYINLSAMPTFIVRFWWNTRSARNAGKHVWIVWKSAQWRTYFSHECVWKYMHACTVKPWQLECKERRSKVCTAPRSTSFVMLLSVTTHLFSHKSAPHCSMFNECYLVTSQSNHVPFFVDTRSTCQCSTITLGHISGRKNMTFFS